jgi:hypothetical protein
MKLIREFFTKEFNSRVIIRSKGSSSEYMDKVLFIEAINMIKNLEDRAEVARETLGLDLYEFEEGYYKVIHNLLRLKFSEMQLELINFYLYDFPNTDEYSGEFELKTGGSTFTHVLKTPEDLWNVLKKLK